MPINLVRHLCNSIKCFSTRKVSYSTTAIYKYWGHRISLQSPCDDLTLYLRKELPIDQYQGDRSMLICRLVVLFYVRFSALYICIGRFLEHARKWRFYGPFLVVLLSWVELLLRGSLKTRKKKYNLLYRIQWVYTLRYPKVHSRIDRLRSLPETKSTEKY